MPLKFLVAGGALFIGFAASAAAADLPNAPLQTSDPSLSEIGWKGWSFGSEATALVSKGKKGQFGGDVFLGYDAALTNGVNLDMRFATGYAPLLTSGPLTKGFDFAEAEAKVSYDMGRLRPYVIGGAGFGRASNFAGPGLSFADGINGVLGGPGQLQAFGTVGVGVDYAVTNNVTFGVGALIGNSAFAH